MITKKGYIYKCFSNWEAILAYIEQKYEKIAVAEDVIFYIKSISEDSFDEICLGIDANNIVYFSAYGSFFTGTKLKEDFDKIFSYPQGERDKIMKRVGDFCRGILIFCENWNEIKQKIDTDSDRYKAVIEFKI